MTRKIIFLFFLAILFGSRTVRATEKDQWFLEGNRLYQAGNYQEALTCYSKILQSGYKSGPLYYNMGNCYYKLSDIGRAILYYERARRIIPNDEDLKANLSMANLSTIDKIEAQNDFVLIALINGFIHLIPRKPLTLLVVLLFWAGVLLLTVWVVSRKSWVRTLALRLSTLFAVLFVLFGMALAMQEKEIRLQDDAVILADKVDVMSAPGSEGVEVFTLHAGTKVRTDQKTDIWIEIILPDRKVGWVKKDVLEVI